MTAQNEEKMSPFDSFISRRFQCRFEDLGMVFPCDLDLAWQAAIAQGEDERKQLQLRLETEMSMRPMWANGFTDDSVAAQVSTSALYEIYKLLGTDNQTSAITKLSESQKREAELQKRVKELEVLVRGYSNDLDIAMGVQHDLETELAKYKEAKPIGIFHRHPYATVEWLTGEAIPDKLKLYAHPDNTKE